jgi:hydrogenase maturation protease
MKVIGLGNEWRHDDGVGLEVARRLGGRGLDGEPIGLVEALAGDDGVVIVDAVSSGAPPGTLHRFDAAGEPLPARLFGTSSTHALGLAEALELARSLGRLPDRVLVYGIEAGDCSFGKGLTPRVAHAVNRVVEEVRACTKST